MASSSFQRNTEFNTSMEEQKEEPNTSHASVVNVGIFSKNSLTMLCIEKLLSSEHQLQHALDQLPPLLTEQYHQIKQDKLKQLLEAALSGDPETVKKCVKLIPFYY